jgi:NitT/TauT family transport system substrate-binding protein
MPGRGDTPSVSRSRARLPIIATALALLTTVSGCGLLGGSDSGGGTTGATSGSAQPGGPVEKTKVKVGILPVVDVAPLYQAIEKGYFKAEGLDVEAATVASGPAAVTGIISGELDIAFTTYPGAFAAQSKKAANLKIIADSYAARPGHLMLVASPKGNFKKPEEAGGKKIAVTSTGSISDLGAMSVLKTKGVEVGKINWVQMKFPDMGPALDRGDIDGAVVAEPFVTTTEKSIGALPILDVSSGPTADISMSGWASVDKFTSANPNTVAAFQRGLNKGVTDVKNDRSKLEPMLVKYVKIDPATASLVHIADYPESLDPVRLQRVADLMLEFKVIQEKLEVAPMLLNGTSSK